jgi:hypothetical protein
MAERLLARIDAASFLHDQIGEHMSDHADLLDEQLGRIREVLGALETHVESTILSGEADMTLHGARLALLADGGGHIWQASEPEGSDEEIAEVVDAVIAHLEAYRTRLRNSGAAPPATTH